MSNDKNICPLTYAVEKGAYDQQVGDFDFCRKEQCAWWHILNIQTKKGRCSILTIAAALHWISVNPKQHTIEVKEK